MPRHRGATADLCDHQGNGGWCRLASERAPGLCVLTASALPAQHRGGGPRRRAHRQPVRGATMATHAQAELRVDVHSIEPIPDADKDSTGPQQMWIWAGANIAPINWALGALGIVLKLGLWETIAVIVVGNIVGCAIFAAFTVMGHKTGVNQMVLGRSAFGRRGAYLPSVLMFLMTLGWIGVQGLGPTGRTNVQYSANFTGSVRLPSIT